MFKANLFLSTLVVTVGAAVGAAEEPVAGSVNISDIFPASSVRYMPPANPLLEHHARAVVPEPLVPVSPAAVKRVQDMSDETPPLALEPMEAGESKVCYGHQSHDAGCYQEACHSCRPSAGDRVRAWWAHTKACLQWSHWGHPEEFEERPFGTSVCAHLRTQVANGMATRMVLYQYDFRDATFNDPSTLNAHGHKRLGDIVAMLQCDIWPVVIEPAEGNPQLDSARRDHVLKALQEWMETVPDEWVVVAAPETRGLHGDEAIEIYDNLLRQTRMGGLNSAATTPRQTLITTVGSSNSAGTGY